MMDAARVRDRFLQMAATARGLLADFREVEQNSGIGRLQPFDLRHRLDEPALLRHDQQPPEDGVRRRGIPISAGIDQEPAVGLDVLASLVEGRVLAAAPAWRREGSRLFTDFGSRLSEFMALYGDSPWLDRLLTLEAIRLACIPYRETFRGKEMEYTPFRCVSRVFSFRFLARGAIGEWWPASIELEVVGLGRWKNDLKSMWGASPPPPPPRRARTRGTAACWVPRSRTSRPDGRRPLILQRRVAGDFPAGTGGFAFFLVDHRGENLRQGAQRKHDPRAGPAASAGMSGSSPTTKFR